MDHNVASIISQDHNFSNSTLLLEKLSNYNSGLLSNYFPLPYEVSRIYQHRSNKPEITMQVSLARLFIAL